MNIPIIKGIIDRRILINYQVDKEVLNNYLPKPFRPKLIKGKGMAGICLIRLKEIRPKGLPRQIGLSSENGAHRIAVEWEENGILKEGVYVPRRDTSSVLNALAGGTVFPGTHHLTSFNVSEGDGKYEVSFHSKDDTFLSIKARETTEWKESSVFDDCACASTFFENGSLGYSPFKNVFEGVELRTYNWKVTILEVEKVRSSFFENEKILPKNSWKFVSALLMKNINHEWIVRNKMTA